MAGRVEGKVAFITGAARGQGRAHAVRLAQEGADIIAIDICERIEGFLNPPSTPEDLARTADLVRGHNRRIVTAEIDVRDYEALKAAVDSGVGQLGRLDVIVANAGISNAGSDDGDTLDKVSERDWQDMIDVNLSGVWKTVKAGVPHILAGSRGGSIVLTSSVNGFKTYTFPRFGHYVAPSFCKRPIVINEGLYKVVRPDLENPGPDDLAPFCQMFHTLPIPWVEAEDISNAVLFLASDESRYITGVTLPIDAGSCLK